MKGIVKEVIIGKRAGDKLKSVESAELEAGKGIVGDRYYYGNGTFSRRLSGMPDVEITLIEQEEIDSFNLVTGRDLLGSDFRRNLVTHGIKLNDLVDKEFSVGEVTLKGIRLCEPCAHLAEFLGKDVLTHTVHKAGLRAQILLGGELKVGATING